MNHSVCEYTIVNVVEFEMLNMFDFSNMRRPVTHWYTKDQPIFENTEEMVDCRIDVTRIPAGSDTPPCLKISHNTFETMEKANWEFLRLSLPVTCQGNFISEQDKMRRWEEIKVRQHRLVADVEAQAQSLAQSSHMDHIMKSGFTMNDLKGLHRNFNEDGVEADEQMHRINPSRSPRQGSLGRGSPTYDMMSSMQRSTSALDIDSYQIDGHLEGQLDDKAEKKRGRSPFKFFKKNRDQSKEKHKSKSPPDRGRGRGTC